MSPRSSNNLVDALLRSFLLRKRGAATGNLRELSNCPDAELVAAYFDRALSNQERSSLESHFARCERCQGMLAAMVRAEPMQSAGKEVLRVRSFHFSRLVRWLAPATAAAAALLLWLALRPAPVPQLPAAGSPTAPPAFLAENRSAGNATNPEKDFHADGQPQRPEAASRIASQVAAVSAPPAKDEERLGIQLSEQKANREGRSERREQFAEPLRTVRAGESPADTVAPQARSGISASAAPDYLSSRAGQEIGKLAQAPESGPRTAEASQLLVRSRESEAAAVRVTPMLEARARRPPSEPGLAISPDPRRRWRVGLAGKIEFSSDGGASWVMQDSGIAADLLAADAPTVSTCWAVGRAGTVLRTTDGRNWTLRKQPTAADLIKVVAQNELTAIVFTADGQTFLTQDGGLSWQVIVLRDPFPLPPSPEPNPKQ